MQYHRDLKVNELDDLMSFDRVIQSDGEGNITDMSGSGVWGPEVIDEEGTLSQHPDHSGWTVMSGWSAQSFYAGPVMDTSERIGGSLADFILSVEGQYVAIYVMSDDNENGEHDIIGWVIAMRNIPEAS